MIRQIIQIDEQKCNGCGLCVTACHEGAIKIIDGKAKLVRDDFCDGLGDCLPSCPQHAIIFVQREAAAYDEKAVLENKLQKERAVESACSSGQCPGLMVRALERAAESVAAQMPPAINRSSAVESTPVSPVISSQLQNWPVQIKLVPVQAPYFQGAHLLIAADCCAYSYASFHADFMRGKVCLIGCPKLDGVNYSEKLTEIIANNSVKSVTIVRMEVPCCGGLECMVTEALRASGKFIPWQVVTLSLDGRVLD